MADLSNSSSNTSHSPHAKQRGPSFRSIFISDVHLGTRDCQAGQLNDFLKSYSCDTLYLVGDIFDGWRMRSGVYWHKSFNRLIRRVLKIAKQGTPVYYVTGNHDEFLRKYANNQFDKIKLVNRITHETKLGERFLVIHGDQFESVTRCSALLKHVGDWGYELLMFLNRLSNRIRARYGFGYWSFASFLKKHIRRAKEYIDDYEVAVAHGAKKQGFDGVICGHIHHPAIKEIEGVHYLNTGDWVESCSAIVEDHNGKFHLLQWLSDPKRLELSQKKVQKFASKREKVKKKTPPSPVTSINRAVDA